MLDNKDKLGITLNLVNTFSRLVNEKTAKAKNDKKRLRTIYLSHRKVLKAYEKASFEEFAKVLHNEITKLEKI